MITSIMIDQREPDWVQKLQFRDIPKLITLLDAGDFLATTDDSALLSIERKTPSDFLGSVADGRLFNQVAAMKRLTPWVYVLVSGAFVADAHGLIVIDGKQTGWNWGSVQGALLQVQEMGGYVIFAHSDADLEPAILRLGEHDRGPVTVRPERQVVALSVAEQILTSLPGIGEKRAAELLAYTGRLGWALCLLTDQNTALAGIGAVTRKKIREALQLEEGETISVLCADGQPAQAASGKAA